MASVLQNKVITTKGYAILKTHLKESDITKIKKELTMTPKVQDKFQRGIVKFQIFYESKTRYFVPRQWGIKHFGIPDEDIISEGVTLPEIVQFSDKFPPHDFQKTIIADFLGRKNGLICVPCGYGKTYMALRIALEIKKRFLIVVDKEFLMNQWKSEIENFTSGLRIGIIQANKMQIDVDKYDVTICMIQTICKREFPDNFFDEYGFTIFDECHHLGASYFCKALLKIQTKYMLGLSATPDREDGLSRVFEYYLGEAVYKNVKRESDSQAVVKAVKFSSEDPIYNDIPTNWRGEPISAKLLNQIAEFEPRNKAILDVLEEYFVNPSRYILLISDRISQLEWFDTQMKKRMINVGFYIGGMKQSVLDENALNCKVLLATYQMVAEGFSVKKLNTIVLATPRKSVQQASGRIFRERINERKVAPHIIDIIDSHPCFVRRWYVRNKFYKECEYNIQHVKHSSKNEIDEEKEEKEEEKTSVFMFKI
jgi:superfamily II DNA or RNA helicase